MHEKEIKELRFYLREYKIAFAYLIKSSLILLNKSKKISVSSHQN